MDAMLGRDREVGSRLPLPQQFRFDAGTLGLNLLATVGQRRSSAPLERMTSVVRLREWMAASGTAQVAVSKEQLADIKTVREAAYRLLTVAPGAAASSDIKILNGWATRPIPGPSLRVRSGGLVLLAPAETFESVVTGLARELVTLAVAPIAPLRACEGPDCGMLYLDNSRGHRRRWCSMSRCGNNAKVSRFRDGKAGAR